MKWANVVGREDAEKPCIGVRVSTRDNEPVEARTLEGMTGESDHDTMSELIESADHRGDGMDGNVIGEYQPGGRVDLAMYRQARCRRWFASDQHSAGGDRVVMIQRNHLFEGGGTDSSLPIMLPYVICGHPEGEIHETAHLRDRQQEKPTWFEQPASGGEIAVKVGRRGARRPDDDQIVLVEGKALFSDVLAVIEHSTAKTRQPPEAGFCVGDCCLVRIGEDILDAIGRRRPEQRPCQPPSPTYDLENTQLASAWDSLVQS